MVRQALREKYLGNAAQRKEALLAVVGLWKDRTDLPNTEAYVRSLRRDSRLKRISK
jgi:hypothetical protein